MTVRVSLRGQTTCDRLRDAFEAAMFFLPDDMAAQVYLTQGSFTSSVGASGGTHAGCGVVDISRFRRDGREWSWSELCLIAEALRRVGIAAWPRERIPGTWERHIHAVGVNCPDLSGAARNQVTAYKSGRDGLRGDARDTLTQAYVNVTWETFQRDNPTFVEDHEMNSDQARQLAGLAADMNAVKTAIANIQVTSNSAWSAAGVDLNENRQRFDVLTARLDKIADAVAALKPYVDGPEAPADSPVSH